MDTLGMHLRKNQDPTQEDPQDPGPPQGSKEATGTASPPKAPKQAKNTPKSTQKHQKAPRMAALGFRQRHQRERGRAETESETNYVLLAYWPLAVCVVETLTIIWSVHLFEKILLFDKVKPRNQSHPILE